LAQQDYGDLMSTDADGEHEDRQDVDPLAGRDPRAGGWTAKALDMLEKRLDDAVEMMEKRIDALRANVNVLMGRQPTGEDHDRVRIFGISIGAWTALITAFASLLAAAALILKGAGS
jgi:hypothetical protein